MVNTLKLPVGIDSFEKIRRNGFYYIDKTNLIEQILMNWGEVTLFTRPRRFGKTLNMSMLKSFFEIGADAALFEGLYIAKNKELCDAYMGKYPVIFLTLKGVEGLTFADAKRMLGTILANEMDRHYYLKTSDALTDEDKAYFAKMLTGTDENIKDSIRKLSQLLYKQMCIRDRITSTPARRAILPTELACCPINPATTAVTFCPDWLTPSATIPLSAHMVRITFFSMERLLLPVIAPICANIVSNCPRPSSGLAILSQLAFTCA